MVRNVRVPQGRLGEGRGGQGGGQRTWPEKRHADLHPPLVALPSAALARAVKYSRHRDDGSAQCGLCAWAGALAPRARPPKRCPGGIGLGAASWTVIVAALVRAGRHASRAARGAPDMCHDRERALSRGPTRWAKHDSGSKLPALRGPGHPCARLAALVGCQVPTAMAHRHGPLRLETREGTAERGGRWRCAFR